MLAGGVIVLEKPAHFGAVGQFYRDFTQVTDEDVVQLLS
jgi:predicted phosphoribosyltransferase